jgi:elongation factor 1-gamma
MPPFLAKNVTLSLTHLVCLQDNSRGTAIRVVAAANKLDLELVETETSEKASAEYLKYNKLGKIPTFVGTDGYVLTEAIAIAIYGENSTLLVARPLSVYHFQ